LQDYYPFGDTFNQYVNTSPTNKYLNQGKEKQEELSTYDFEWRMYDPLAVRTWQIDKHTFAKATVIKKKTIPRLL